MKTILTVLILIISISAYAQDKEKKIDDYLSTELGKLQVPNMDITVVNSDGILFSRSFGFKESNSDSYYLGSVSKSLTALGILKLIESGKLDFENKLSEIIPNINYNEHARKITIRHLLNHTSGISKLAGFEYLPSLNEISTSKYSLYIIESPDKNHEYSNLNYSLLGLIIEQISGKSFLEFMTSEVFTPLQMNNSKIYLNRKTNNNIISQYQYWGPFPIKSKQFDYASTAIPAGFILSNTEDMSNYLSMMLKQGQFRTDRFIEKSLITLMLTPWNKTGYGYCMGWKKGMYNGKTIYQHLGTTATSYSAIFIIPEKNIGFSLLTNTNSLSYTEDITEGILNILTDGEKKEVAGAELYLRIGVLIAMLFSVINLVFKIVKQIRRRLHTKLKNIIISFGINTFVILLFLFAFPQITKVPFISFIKMQPDIGTLIIFLLISPIILNTFKLINQYSLNKKNEARAGNILYEQ
jgi:CubicO group peptidase (beta-lactamase class C family)